MNIFYKVKIKPFSDIKKEKFNTIYQVFIYDEIFFFPLFLFTIILFIIFTCPVNAYTAEEWANLGIQYNQEYRYTQAIEAFNQSIALDADNSNTWFNLGNSYFFSGNTNDAFNAYSTSIRLNPNNYQAWTGLGIVLNTMGRDDEALFHFENAIRLNPSYGDAWGGKGYTLLKTNEFSKALSAYERAIEIKPMDISNWIGRGIALYNLNESKEALKAFDHALGIDPTNEVALNYKNLTEKKIRDEYELLVTLEQTFLPSNTYTPLLTVTPSITEKPILYSSTVFPTAFLPSPTISPTITETSTPNSPVVNPVTSISFPSVVDTPPSGTLDFGNPDLFALFSLLVGLIIGISFMINKLRISHNIGNKTQIQKAQKLLTQWKRALEAANKKVKVPTSILVLTANPDPESISIALNKLEEFQKNARPVLDISLANLRFIAGKWYKAGVTIINSGDAHAFNVKFSFSDEFEAKRIKPIQLESGDTCIVEIGLMAKNSGSIPFEITVYYTDGNNRDYTENHEFWMDVTEPTLGIQATTTTLKYENSRIRKNIQEINSPLRTSLGSNSSHEVFITYSHFDKPIADAVCATLENNNIRCWISPRDVLPGENFTDAIIQAIINTKIMVLIYSSHSNTSQHVIRELTKAVSTGVIIIPFRIEDAPLSPSMDYLIGLPHWLDALTPPLEKHIDILVQRIKAILNIHE